jgi:chromosomal replication initiator protein
VSTLLQLMVGILGGVLVGLVIADVQGWLLKGCRLLVVAAAQLLPERKQARYAEEWQADLIAVRNTPLTMVALAVWTALRAPRWAAQLRRKAIDDDRDSSIPDLLAARITGLNPSYTFERFVVGDPNRLAHAAALAVAEAPSGAYNPLFLHGAPGLGKTHLMAAIANYLSCGPTGLNIRYTTAEAFTNEFVAALKSSGSDEFKARYRDLDVLLLDDVQFLEGKPATEEEFFHTFNALYESGSQLVLSADRIPSELSTLAARLRDRFEWGLTVGIERPDSATRLAVLQQLVQESGVEVVDEKALVELASRSDANVRQLHGAFIRVIAHASLMGRPLDSKLIAQVIPSRGTRKRQIEVVAIQQQVAERFGIARAEVVGSSQLSSVVLARGAAIYLTRELTDLSLPQIGRVFGGRNHSAVLSALRDFEACLAEDLALKDTISALCRKLSR